MFKKLLPLIFLVPAISIAQSDYVNSDESRYVNFLLNIRKSAPSEIEQFKNVTDDSDTHLKKDFSSIKLVVPFYGLKQINNKNVIGYAPIGTYSHGWTGIKVFFIDNLGNNCAYSKERIIDVKLVSNCSHFVNGKPSFKMIRGNENGYIYNVTWYTIHNDMLLEQLDCATKKLDKSVLGNLENLEINIDKGII